MKIAPPAVSTWQSADQRGDAPRYQFYRQQQSWCDRHNYNRVNNREAPRRGMQPIFYRGSSGAGGGYNNVGGGYGNLPEGCYQCRTLRNANLECVEPYFLLVPPVAELDIFLRDARHVLDTDQIVLLLELVPRQENVAQIK